VVTPAVLELMVTMASESDGPQTLRLSNHVRFYDDDLALPTGIGKDVWARLESKANQLRK
jgi:hypothetical protein